MTPKLTAYVNIGCPFARRAMLTAALKGLATEQVWIPLSGMLKKVEADGIRSSPLVARLWPGKSIEELKQMKADYIRDINPTGEVPTLVVETGAGKDVIAEADVVAEYLEDAFPDSGASLMPKDAAARSRIRHWLKVLNGDLGVRAMYGLLMSQDPTKDADLRDKIYKGLATFASLSSNDGPFFLGSSISLADVLLIPFWDQFRFLLPHYRAVPLIPTPVDVRGDVSWVPRLEKWAVAVEGLEDFKQVRLEKDDYIGAYAGYAGSRGVSLLTPL